MKRANTIARIRAVRRAISALALACLFVIILHANEPRMPKAMQNERPNKSQTIAFLPPNKEVKIVKK